MLVLLLQKAVPAIQILDDRGEVLTEKFYNSGSTIELQCVVANVPTASSLQLAWYHGENRLNYDARRGGVSVKTELRGTLAKSWLRVGDAKTEDSGIYYCNVTELSATSVTIHVVAEKYPAAMQGAWSPTTDRGVPWLVTTVLALLWFSVCNSCRDR
ncbi:hypothetical protein HAZT_HAZT002450 [Hyalella azteca]|uniref:Ig-like domain-containing protein n=1 Tax=Hyalella azteca TaxID=294128 RepID=A0A6A0GYC4_HYAAZ|nr:hypothetical protein HAZT_HAZT002450 [Hyalella azteca]